MTDRLGTPEHARWLGAETDRLLDFSVGSRHPDGGFGWLDDHGGLRLEAPVPLWVTCRMTHVFALGHLLGRSDCGPLVDHGVAALTGRFRDAAHGGWWASVDGGGPVRRDKAAYEHAFVLLAASSAACAGRPGSAELLDEALDVLLGRFWDDQQGMVVEVWDEGFTRLEDYRGVNANMHAVEALLAASDVTGDRSHADRALRVVERAVHGFARGNDWRLPEHFTGEWGPLPEYNADDPAHPFRPYGATVGHWLEWSRLALQLRATLDRHALGSAPPWVLPDSQALFGTAVDEGWAVDGEDGFVYTVDWDGKPVVRDRLHWVAAEGVAAAAALHAVTGDEQYARWYGTWWDHVEAVFVDRADGSWRHELDPQNRPSNRVWEGKPDTYHAVQATLLPRLPVAPAISVALRDGLLDSR